MADMTAYKWMQFCMWKGVQSICTSKVGEPKSISQWVCIYTFGADNLLDPNELFLKMWSNDSDMLLF